MHTFRTALAAAPLILAVAGIQAAPLDYDEAVYGDIGSHPSGRESLRFGTGTNKVRGTMHFTSLGGFDTTTADLDSFVFDLPEGTKLGNVAVKTRYHGDTANTEFFDVFWGLVNSNFTKWTTTCYDFVQSNTNCPLAPAGGALFTERDFDDISYMASPSFYMLWKDFDQPLGGSFSYELSFDVNAVPEPGSLALLLAAGVPALLSTRRRRPAR